MSLSVTNLFAGSKSLLTFCLSKNLYALVNQLIIIHIITDMQGTEPKLVLNLYFVFSEMLTTKQKPCRSLYMNGQSIEKMKATNDETRIVFHAATFAWCSWRWYTSHCSRTINNKNKHCSLTRKIHTDISTY